MKKCFISAPVNVDLSVLRTVLASKGIQAVMPFELEIVGSNFREQIEHAIQKADFFIAVLSRSGSANVFFELGFATAKLKRIVLLQTEEFEIPQNLSGFTILRADVRDGPKLSNVLDDFLKKQRHLKPARQEIVRTRPLSTRATELIQHLKNLQARATHAEFEKILTAAFKDSGIEVVAEPQGKDRGYDFALWLDELNHLVGNPLLVEVKTKLSKAEAKSLKSKFLKHRDTELGKALVVVFLDGPEAIVQAESSGAPLILFVPAAVLLSALEEKSLGDFIRSERNRLVHGV
jgi:hypothetical protein